MASDQGNISTRAPAATCQVFPAAAFAVTAGANLHDPIAPADEVCAGDIYQLAPDARALRLAITPASAADGIRQPIAQGSEIGQPGEAVQIAARLTFMGAEGDVVDVLVLVHHGAAGPAIYALPLSPLVAKSDYTLVAVCEDPREVRLADLVCISFGRGTKITLSDGRQAAVESLRPGDRVLTRDHGAQPLRWIGRATLRASGSFAPVVISAGTLGNEGDLIVGQHHRLFLYQRQARLAKTAEVLVQAKHLVDDTRIFLREGGMTDYFSLIFDRHEIIYAEGIPAESLMVTEATLTRLPDDLARELKGRFPGLSHRPHFGTEASRHVLDRIGPAALFRQARAS
ncbi:MAG: Hint domain-containing protein [Paracoccaceae bacterium]|nr:Hint domain-containing protein [Paracoccaceae bacterium]